MASLNDLEVGKRYSVYDARARKELVFGVVQDGCKVMIKFEGSHITPINYDPVLIFDKKEWDSIKPV